MVSHYQPYYYSACHHHDPTTAPSAAAVTTTTSSSCYYCSYYNRCTPPHHPIPPDPNLHQFHHQPLPPPHPFSPHHHHHPPTQPHPQPPQDPHFFQDQREEGSTHPLIISSLLRRISALEAALKCHSSSSPSSYSLRDAAVRTIQTHFRAFLVRRSRTLGQLKHLASVKSAVNAIRSSVSGNAHFDPQAITLEAMDLFHELDTIQGGDPMIRDGKRSISRDLIRLMDFVGGVNVAKKNGFGSRMMRNVRSGGNVNYTRDLCSNKKRVSVESVKVGRCEDVIGKLKERLERVNGLSRVSEEDVEEDEEVESPILSLSRRSGVGIGKGCGLMRGNSGAQAKAKRSVTFVENGNAYRLFSVHDPISNGDCNSMDGCDSGEVVGELVGNLGRRVEEIGLSSKETGKDEEEAEIEEEGSTQSSDGEQVAKDHVKVRGGGRLDQRGSDQEEDGSFVFYAPLPVKMESRADFLNKKKPVKA